MTGLSDASLQEQLRAGMCSLPDGLRRERLSLAEYRCTLRFGNHHSKEHAGRGFRVIQTKRSTLALRTKPFRQGHGNAPDAFIVKGPCKLGKAIRLRDDKPVQADWMCPCAGSRRDPAHAQGPSRRNSGGTLGPPRRLTGDSGEAQLGSKNAKNAFRYRRLPLSSGSYIETSFSICGVSSPSGNISMDRAPSAPNRWTIRPASSFASASTILSPWPGVKEPRDDPSSITQHSTNGPELDNSIRIVPPRSSKAWRAEFVINSDTIMPSLQQRSERI